MTDKTTTEQRDQLRRSLAVCKCSQLGASGFTDNFGVTHWTCCQCGFRYESPPRVDRKLALALLDDVASLAKERDAVLARAIAALHPHWPEGARKTYAPEQLPAMVERLTAERDALLEQLEMICDAAKDAVTDGDAAGFTARTSTMLRAYLASRKEDDDGRTNDMPAMRLAPRGRPRLHRSHADAATIADLRAALTRANAGFEEHERKWYLALDEAEALRAQLADRDAALARLADVRSILSGRMGLDNGDLAKRLHALAEIAAFEPSRVVAQMLDGLSLLYAQTDDAASLDGAMREATLTEVEDAIIAEIHDPRTLAGDRTGLTIASAIVRVIKARGAAPAKED